MAEVINQDIFQVLDGQVPQDELDEDQASYAEEYKISVPAVLHNLQIFMIDPENVPVVKGTPENIPIILDLLKSCYHLGGVKLFKLQFLKDDWTAEKCADQSLHKMRKDATDLDKILTFFTKKVTVSGTQGREHRSPIMNIFHFLA
jgi:hypothetical protein